MKQVTILLTKYTDFWGRFEANQVSFCFLRSAWCSQYWRALVQHLLHKAVFLRIVGMGSRCVWSVFDFTHSASDWCVLGGRCFLDSFESFVQVCPRTYLRALWGTQHRRDFCACYPTFAQIFWQSHFGLQNFVFCIGNRFGTGLHFPIGISLDMVDICSNGNCIYYSILVASVCFAWPFRVAIEHLISYKTKRDGA